jgi:hypothetical protein
MASHLGGAHAVAVLQDFAGEDVLGLRGLDDLEG